MEDKQIEVLVQSALNYFKALPNSEVNIGTPFLNNQGQNQTYDFSGLISISGVREGWVCFTATRDMLNSLLLEQGEDELSHENIKDLVGELANTVSGNLRRYFGNRFIISVPTVLEGSNKADSRLITQGRSYVVPLQWQQQDSSMLFYLR